MEIYDKILARRRANRFRLDTPAVKSWERSGVTFLSWEQVLPPMILMAVIVVVGTWFGSPESQFTPMGDAYIHYQYARNLVVYGELSYNPGIVEGIGSTSILWILILAACIKMGVPAVAAGQVLGIALLAFCGILIYDLVQSLRAAPRYSWRGILPAGMVSLLVCLSGNFIWIGLSGMETMLFLDLSLLALGLYVRRNIFATGVVLGLLTLTRVDGVALMGVMVLVELGHRRRIDSDLVKLVTPFLMLTLPWFGYLCWREGLPLPGSYQGKQVSYVQTLRMMDARNPALARLTHIKPLVFLSAWVGYGLLFMAGGAGLPGPSLSLPGVWDGAELQVPFLSVVFFLLVSIPAAILFGRYLVRCVRDGWVGERQSRFLVVAILWTLGHNLAYAVFMPQPGSAGRYVPMNHVFFWTSLVFLALWVKNQALKFMIGTLVITILGTSLGYWHQVYHMNIAYMQDVRMPATRYVEDNCPLDTPVGSTDLGPLRYHIQQPVLDLIGYVNKDIVPVWQNGGSIEDYILDQGISCLSVFMPVDGVGVDTVKVMGLAPDSRYDLRLERTFGVTTDDWLVGSSPVSNYMPAIAIYRIKRLE